MQALSTLEELAAAALAEAGGDPGRALGVFQRWLEATPALQQQYVAWGCATGWWTAETWGRENGLWEAGLRTLLATARGDR